MELQPQSAPLEGVNKLPFAEPKPNKPLDGVTFKKPLDIKPSPQAQALREQASREIAREAMIPDSPLDMRGLQPMTQAMPGLKQAFLAVAAVEANMSLHAELSSADTFQNSINTANALGLASESITKASVEVVPDDLELPLDALPSVSGTMKTEPWPWDDMKFQDVFEKDFSAYGGIKFRYSNYWDSQRATRLFWSPSLRKIRVKRHNGANFIRFMISGWSCNNTSDSSDWSAWVFKFEDQTSGGCGGKTQEYNPNGETVSTIRPVKNPARVALREQNLGEVLDPTGFSGLEPFNIPGFSTEPFLDTEALEEKLEQGFTEAELQDGSNWEDIPDSELTPRRDPLTGEIDETKPPVPPWALPDDEWLVTPDGFTTTDPPENPGDPPKTPPPPTPPEIPEEPPPEETCDPCEKLDEVLAALAALDLSTLDRIYWILGGDRWYPGTTMPSFDIDAEAALNVARTMLYSDDEQEDSNTVNATDLITLLQVMAAVQYQRSGFHRLPAVVPENLVLDPDEDEDSNIRILDLFSWQEWQLKQLDQLFGAWPLKINYKDAEGEESVVKLENTSEAIAELYGLLLNIAGESDLQTELVFKAITEAIGAKVAATNAYDYAKGNAEFLGYKGNSKNKEIPLTITPGAENLKDSLKEGKKKLPRWQNEDQLDLVSLTTKILFAAEIIKSVFYQEYDAERGLYGETLADRRKDEQGQEEDRWRQFLDELRNPSGVRYNELNPRPDIQNLASEENDGD